MTATTLDLSAIRTDATTYAATFRSLIGVDLLQAQIDTFAELNAIVADQSLLYAGSALGTPSSGVLSSCTGYEGTAVASTGEAGGTKYLREDGDGTCSWQAVAAGDVTKVGTPVNNQIGVWTGDGTLEGDAGLTFDGATLTLPGAISAPSVIGIKPYGTLRQGFGYGSGGANGFQLRSDGNIGFASAAAIGGANDSYIKSGGVGIISIYAGDGTTLGTLSAGTITGTVATATNEAAIFKSSDDSTTKNLLECRDSLDNVVASIGATGAATFDGVVSLTPSSGNAHEKIISADTAYSLIDIGSTPVPTANAWQIGRDTSTGVATGNAGALFVWNWSANAEALNIDQSSKATFSGTIKTAAATTSIASLNIPSGTAPTSPTNGDIWSDGSDILVRLGGVTYTLTKT